MIAFLDTEFTDLVTRPHLLSVGIVTAHGEGNGQAFYAEVTDSAHLSAASWYASAVVLPQFGKVAHAACSHTELGTRLSVFLAGLVAGLHSGEFLQLAHGYHLDWELVDLAVQASGSRTWAATRRRIHPVNVHHLTGSGPGKAAAEAYFKTQALAPYSRHHALCDARALRLAYEAATQAPAWPSQTWMPAATA